MEDNWSDRSTFHCGTCMWYVSKQVARETGLRDMPTVTAESIIGRCRRHAPSAGGHGWPVVYLTDWCGDHKIK